MYNPEERSKEKPKNYLGRSYPDTIEGFAKWCRDFPPLENGKNRKFMRKWHEGILYYLCLEHVSGSYGDGRYVYDFVGATLKFYDNDRKEFGYVSKDGLIQEVFGAELAAYEQENNTKMYF